MNIIITGIQGSGKGTQAELLAATFDLKHISTGDVLREHIDKKTSIGLEYVNGNFAPDEILFELVAHETEQLDGKSGYIIDGFPRTQAQAEWVMENLAIDYVVNLDIAEKVALNRLLLRGRLDDNEEVINAGFSAYKEKTLPCIEVIGVDVNIDCDTKEMTEIHDEIVTKILEIPYPLDYNVMEWISGMLIYSLPLAGLLIMAWLIALNN